MRIRHFLIFLLLTSFSSLLSAQTTSIPEKQTQIGFAALDFLSVKMPIDIYGNPEQNMNLAGVHYNIWLNNSIYTGLGFYGAVAGRRGGLFTLGINAGIRKVIGAHTFLDTGFHLGGGGGASAPEGGGAFIMPHLNIGYQFKKFSATAGYSYINFFDRGNIVSHQLNIGVQIPLLYDYASFEDREKKFSIPRLKTSSWNQEFKHISLLFHLDQLSPFGKSAFTDGSSLLGKHIYLAGFELNWQLSKKWFTYFRADGAFHGIRGGYMDLLLGGGYVYSMNQSRTNLITKFGIGAGGGGGVDTAGGFLIAPSISLEQKVFNNLYIAINKGYLMNVDDHFSASTLGFGIKYYVNQQGIYGKEQTEVNSGVFKGIQIILGEEVYLDAARILIPKQNLSQLSMQINLFLNTSFYVSGQTSFANFGNAGAYAEGLVGLGINSKPLLNNRIDLFAQVLAGAAGGGEISTGQGLVIKPSLGVNYRMNSQLNIRAALGKVFAKNGELSSTSINIGLNYHLSFLKVD